MARAKRTDRAEARRRYRQAIAVEGAEGDLDPMTDAAGVDSIPAAARPNRSAAPKPAARPTQARPGLVASLRIAAAPADVRGDLRALPQIVLRTKAFLLPAVLAVISGAVFLIVGQEGNVIAVLAFQAFVVPPPMAASFLGGLLAPRAGWAVGGLVGLAASLVFTVVAIAYPETSSGTTGTVANTMEQRQNAIVFALFVSPMIGIAVGAFAGFYRRFLRAASPDQPRADRQKRAASRR